MKEDYEEDVAKGEVDNDYYVRLKQVSHILEAHEKNDTDSKLEEGARKVDVVKNELEIFDVESGQVQAVSKRSSESMTPDSILK